MNVTYAGTQLGKIKAIEEYVWRRNVARIEKDGYLNANREREEKLRYPPSIEELEEELEEKRQLKADLLRKIVEKEEEIEEQKKEEEERERNERVALLAWLEEWAEYWEYREALEAAEKYVDLCENKK